MVNTPEGEWCDYGDMPKIMCEHCITGEKNAGTSRGVGVVESRPFVKGEGAAVPAVYNGPCAAGKDCTKGGDIVKDEWITHTPKGWAHEECA